MMQVVSRNTFDMKCGHARRIDAKISRFETKIWILKLSQKFLDFLNRVLILLLQELLGQLQWNFWSLRYEDMDWKPLLKNPSLYDRIAYMKLDGDFIRLIPNEI